MYDTLNPNNPSRGGAVAYTIRKNGDQSYYIIDTSIPGGRDVEHQTSPERAQAALLRWQATTPGPRLVVGVDASQPQQSLSVVDGAADARRAALSGLIAGKAADARAAVGRLSSAADLRILAEMEEQGKGRKTVLNAIAERLEQVA